MTKFKILCLLLFNFTWICNIKSHDISFSGKNHQQYFNQKPQEKTYEWGFEQDDGQYRFEKKSDGVVYGCHGHFDPNNKQINKFYVADINGYHEYNAKDLSNLLRYDQPQQLQDYQLQSIESSGRSSYFPQECAKYRSQAQTVPAPIAPRPVSPAAPLQGGHYHGGKPPVKPQSPSGGQYQGGVSRPKPQSPSTGGHHHGGGSPSVKPQTESSRPHRPCSSGLCQSRPGSGGIGGLGSNYAPGAPINQDLAPQAQPVSEEYVISGEFTYGNNTTSYENQGSSQSISNNNATHATASTSSQSNNSSITTGPGSQSSANQWGQNQQSSTNWTTGTKPSEAQSGNWSYGGGSSWGSSWEQKENSSWSNTGESGSGGKSTISQFYFKNHLFCT
jgi:hypothetical protein